MEEITTKEEMAPDSRAMTMFREKTNIAISRMKNLEEFRDSDPMVDFVFATGRSMFDKPLDQMAPQWLINTGGRLTGVYAYLGNKAARARAQRDIYEQKRDEVMARISLDEYPETEKITVARAKAKVEVAEIDEIVSIMEYEKNNYENIMQATQTMIVFLQSAIKVKEGERYRGDMHNENE